ncbi:MAG TPA: hypothetical protein VFX13_18395 [Gaiellales bacterium]|jgi:hypothetical protein|nr:hypothetical protein [Gaiellales bacterium]
MSDSGPGPDIVVTAMFAAAVVLAALACLPAARLGNAVGPVAAALVVLAVAGAAALATMKAGVYADGTSHWHHMSQPLLLAGGTISLVSAAVLYSAHRVAAVRAALAAGSAGTLLLALSPFTYTTPG